MAKKKAVEVIDNSILNEENLEAVMGDRFGRYSKYIIQERAIPDVRDGLKPVQRRIVYAMNKEGNTFDKPYRKSAKTVGLVIGNYHPHGDTSVYDAMVRMSQNWKLNLPLIDMHGNNGSIDNDPAAAMRYTEARLSKISSLLTDDLPYNTVNWTPNYDDSEMEPSVLPCKIPLLLMNGSMGIAAGYATNIPPFNFNEVINAVIYRLKHKRIDSGEFYETIKGPDFPTGGVIYNKNDIVNAMKTGKGKIVLRSKTKTEVGKTSKEIIISEIPYEVVKSELVSQIDDIRINKKVDSIISVRDESDRKGLRIVVEIKKTADENAVLHYLYKNTDLQVNYNLNMVAIVDNKPELCGVERIIDSFIKHRKDVVLRRSNYLLSKNEARINIIDGFLKAVSVMDEVIKTIRASKDKADVVKNLENKFGFNNAQAEAIANMRLYRLSNTDILALKKEKEDLLKVNKKLNTIIGSDAGLTKELVRELEEINTNMVITRRTKINESAAEIKINENKLVSDETVMLTISKAGYIKRVNMRSFNATDDNTGLKEGDELISEIECSTLDTILLFTKNGCFVKTPVHKIPDMKWKDVGEHISMFGKTDEDSIIGYKLLKNGEKYNLSIISLSKKGQIKSTNLKATEMPSRVGKLPVFMKLRKDDEIVDIEFVNKGDEILIVTEKGFANRYSVKEVPDSTIATMGIVSSKLENDDANVCVFNLRDKNRISLITDSGNKNFNVEDIKKTKRGNKGNNLFATRKSSIKVRGIVRDQ